MSSLKRELGRWDLTAIGVNQVIGGAVFLMAAPLALQIGAWSAIAVALVGLLSLMIALNFAEAGSRFDGTGGAYLYTRAAFGRFFSFEVGWMMWITRVASWASVVNGLTTALAFYWPTLGADQPGLARESVITLVILTIMTVNVLGIRQSAWVVNTLTIGKLTPLVIFIALGLPHVDIAALQPDTALTWTQISTAALLLIFAYGGYEVVGVPAGEARNPKRDVPFAMVMTIVIVAIVMTLAQVVAMGTLPGIADSQRPLADASLLFLGAWGALLMTTGGAVSMSGNNMGQALSGSRNLYALAEQGDLPSWFGRVHPTFRTPAVAIVFTSLVALWLALSGDFVTLAAASAVSRLLVYAGTCASVLKLRGQGRAPFTIPGGPVIPVVALTVSLAILGGATSVQLQVGGVALVVGGVLYMVARWRKSGVVVGVLLGMLLAAPAVASAQMVILVRHAERADAGAPAGAAMTAAPDPELSAAGTARAEALARMLKDAGITRIITTEFRRTIDTALPLSDALGLVSDTIAARDQAALIAQLKAHTTGAVLVVGHSNTVPEIIKALGGPSVTIGEQEYDNLFFVGPGGAMTRIRFTP